MNLEVVLNQNEAGQRLDQVLAERFPDLSRSVLQRWLDQGQITVDGEVATRKTKAVPGAKVQIVPASPPPSKALPQDLPLRIVYEDEHLIAIDKAAGMVVHPAPGHPDGTLVNALLHHSNPLGGEEETRPGIVHRLDKDTSGVMIAAKSARAHEELIKMFQRHDLQRTYQAIAVGHLSKEQGFDTLHARHPAHRKRYTSKTDKGKRAFTKVVPIELMYGTTLLNCTLQTGRTHQIRVHLADAKHPVLGDTLYGKSISDPKVRAISQRLGRQALHAKSLAFKHPISNEALEFQTPPPPDFEEALAALRALPER